MIATFTSGMIRTASEDARFIKTLSVFVNTVSHLLWNGFESKRLTLDRLWEVERICVCDGSLSMENPSKKMEAGRHV